MITLVPNKPYAPAATTGGYNKPQSNNIPQHLQNNHHSNNGREPLSPKMSVSPPPAPVTPPKSDSPRDSVTSLSQASLKQRVSAIIMIVKLRVISKLLDISCEVFKL